ncbi:low-density lipoprotein receptor-related protein 5-like [Mytilus californianus]|uniref:low-density lipoprotein receptor-related protein 5-like n=1 Tax=Mytilus californianus TaxID=6549 RepID=UPI0022486CA4|nr:low-density lipoprotein receptor-related protein 5-like [Mytilus californianus]XP_052080606.1 low-density lipoprotein receptor-related protein 5-like [Mytilus californianus]
MKWHRLIFSVLIIFVCLITQGFPSKLVFSTNMTDSNGRIYEFNLDTGRVSYILTNLQSDVYSIAYDYNNGYIYIPRLHKNDIQRVKYPSDQAYTPEFVTNASVPIGIAIDPLYGNVYWTEYNVGKAGNIYRCNLNGSDKFLVLNDDPLFALTLDYRYRWLYYSTTLTAKKRSIRRSRLDGTRNQTVIEEEASDLSIDFIEERLYWMNFATGDLKSAYLNGTNDRKLFSTNTTIQNVGIYVLDDEIYCVNFNEILKVTLQPVTSASVIYAGTKRIYGLLVYKEKRKYLYRNLRNYKLPMFKSNILTKNANHGNKHRVRESL